MSSTSATSNHVVCAIDAQMTYGLIVLLSSMADTATQPFRVTVGYLDESLPAPDRETIATVSRALDIPLEFLALESHELFITQGHISKTTFAKFLLADAIPGAHLWIDADTVALPGWDEIFAHINKATASEGLVVAVRGSGARATERNKPSNLKFNAGVLGWPASPRRDWQGPLATMDHVETQEQALFNQLYGTTARTVPEAFNTLTYRVEKLSDSALPSIIHFAGAHKPWHLTNNLKIVCLDYRCPWSAWLEAEQSLLEKQSLLPALEEIYSLQRRALLSGRFSWNRDHSGLRLLKGLQLLGPLAGPITRLLRLMSRRAPRGTHPLHPLGER